MSDEMIGRVIGRYRIVAYLGGGAMGDVYRATDSRLDCDVALKILRPEAWADPRARSRFRQEASALARPAHPNLVTIRDYDTDGDTDFIVMEYLAWTTVAEMVRGGGLDERTVRALGRQMAKGMSATHRSGIIHRDLKPLNLMVSAEGDLKIVDFGLAKFVTGDASMTATALTDPGSVVGTLPYMAPELFRYRNADVRSDVYSAGVVLYEMATGRRPHEGSTKEEIIRSALENTPTPPTRWNPGLSAGLESIILKALDRDPSRRYQSAADLQADLDRLDGAAEGAPPKRETATARTVRRVVLPLVALGVIAASAWALYGLTQGPTGLLVLPLRDATDDPGQAYFADGMTEELIKSLGRIERLPVISLSTAMQFRDTAPPSDEVRKRLRVRWLVEGKVARRGDDVEIHVELIDAPRRRHVWAERYRRGVGNALALQSEVSEAIAREINRRLPSPRGEPAEARRTVRPAALDAYLRGRHLWNQRDPTQIQDAIQKYVAAVEADPDFALPHAALADAYGLLGNYGILPQSIAYATAKEESRLALALDPRLSDAHVSLAMVKMEFEWDWDGAEAEFRRAIELADGNATAHQWYADLLSRLGRSRDALRHVEKARELDPLSAPVLGMFGTVLYYGGDPVAALQRYDESLELGPRQPLAHFYRGLALLDLKRSDEALEAFEHAVRFSQGSPLTRSGLAVAYARTGRSEEARGILRELEADRGTTLRPTCLALIAIALDDREAALRYIAEGERVRDSYLGHMKVLPIAKPLRSEPRFVAVMRRVGLGEN